MTPTYCRPQFQRLPRAHTGRRTPDKRFKLHVVEETVGVDERAGPGIQSLGLNGARFKGIRIIPLPPGLLSDASFFLNLPFAGD